MLRSDWLILISRDVIVARHHGAVNASYFEFVDTYHNTMCIKPWYESEYNTIVGRVARLFWCRFQISNLESDKWWRLAVRQSWIFDINIIISKNYLKVPYYKCLVTTLKRETTSFTQRQNFCPRYTQRKERHSSSILTIYLEKCMAHSRQIKLT